MRVRLNESLGKLLYEKFLREKKTRKITQAKAAKEIGTNVITFRDACMGIIGKKTEPKFLKWLTKGKKK
jgi:hypothetical protein